ncbi:hypothetical protein J5277_14145 [Rhizobium sp. 16-449-1b]|nr:hypothetical protein [Rhizobium sp. 16-449-1b]MBO9195245.1 hypothetical protein [Rhizobium sp. 16-449-1b]
MADARFKMKMPDPQGIWRKADIAQHLPDTLLPAIRSVDFQHFQQKRDR